MTKTDALDLIDTFVHIASAGSLSKAALDLDTTQATVSRKLKRLESLLRSELVTRSTHHSVLTPTGERFLVDARALLDHWNDIEYRYVTQESRISGSLKIVAPTSMGQRFMTDLAIDFQLAHPDVQLSWVLQDETFRFTEVACDLWIRLGESAAEDLVVERLAETERLPVASPALLAGREIVDIDDLESLPLIALVPTDNTIRLTSRDGALARILRPRAPLRTNNFFAQYRAALRGLGFCILPAWFVRDDLASGKLVHVLPDWRPSPLSINAAYRPSRFQHARIARFVDMLAEGLSEVPEVRVLPRSKLRRGAADERPLAQV